MCENSGNKELADKYAVEGGVNANQLEREDDGDEAC